MVLVSGCGSTDIKLSPEVVKKIKSGECAIALLNLDDSELKTLDGEETPYKKIYSLSVVCK